MERSYQLRRTLACLFVFLFSLSLQGQMFPPATGSGSGASLPSQTGHAGEFLGTDGTNAAWYAITTAPYGADFTSQTSVTLTHSYGTRDVYFRCIDTSYHPISPETATYTSTSAIDITFNPSQSGRCAVFNNGGGSGGGSMTYPGAGVANSTGSAWGTSYSVGTSANNLLQLNSSAQIPAVSGALVTALNASALASGTVPTARLGTGTADNTTYLRGDGTWATGAGGGGSGVADGTSLLGAGTEGDPLRVNPATVPTRITGTASLSMSTFTNSCEEGNITVTGAATGDEVIIGAPTGIGAGLLWSAYVSSSNTVTLRICRVAGTATISAQTFRATIVRSF